MFAVIPAAGSGSRMGAFASARSKLLVSLDCSITVLELAFRSIAEAGVCKGVVIAVRPEEIEEMREIAEKSFPGLDIRMVEGGQTRQESVFRSLETVKDSAQYVLIHDAARPFCKPELIRDVAEAARSTKAAILATAVKSTLKQSDDGVYVKETLNREGVWAAQTPQAFYFDLIYNAHLRAIEEGFSATDDSQLVEHLGLRVSIVRGSEANVKITTPEDLRLARFIAAGLLRGVR